MVLLYIFKTLFVTVAVVIWGNSSVYWFVYCSDVYIYSHQHFKTPTECSDTCQSWCTSCLTHIMPWVTSCVNSLSLRHVFWGVVQCLFNILLYCRQEYQFRY